MGTESKGLPCAKVGFNVTKQYFGILKYLMMQLHPGKCPLLSPWVLSSTRLNKGARIASETFWEGNYRVIQVHFA